MIFVVIQAGYEDGPGGDAFGYPERDGGDAPCMFHFKVHLPRYTKTRYSLVYLARMRIGRFREAVLRVCT